MKKTILSGLFLMVSLMILGCGGEKAETKPAAAAPVERPPVQQAPACTGQMRMRNMC